MPTKPQVIALEEHYLDPEVKPLHHAVATSRGSPRSPRGSTMSARAASPRWTRPASTSRCCRTARRRCSGSSRRRRSAWRAAPTTGSPRRCSAHPDRFAAFRGAADRRPQGRGRRARAHRHQARLQGRDDARPDRRPLSRRQAVLADLRARAGARRAALPAPRRCRTRR